MVDLSFSEWRSYFSFSLSWDIFFCLYQNTDIAIRKLITKRWNGLVVGIILLGVLAGNAIISSLISLGIAIDYSDIMSLSETR